MMTQQNHPFSVFNLILFVLYTIIFYTIYSLKKKNIPLASVKYYRYNFFLKIVLVLVFSAYYFFTVGGGDTIAYWDGAVCLNNLFWKSPSSFFEELFSLPDANLFWQHFGVYNTGLPPGWIYREPESWFISKICSFITFITFKSYLAGSVFFAFLLAKASWRLFELVESFKIHQTKHVAFATLLIPSVAFWCSGITKDTIVLLSIIYINVNFLELLLRVPGNNKKRILFIVFYGFLLYHIRDFMIMVIFVSFMVVLMARLSNKYRNKPFAFYSLRILTIVIGVFLFVSQGNKLAESEQLKQAEIVSKDFESNKSYEGARYDVGVTSFTPSGLLIGVLPAVIAGVYRPFIWEAFTPSLIFNGLESLYFLYLTWFFVKEGFFQKIKQIRQHEFLVFAIVFAVLLSFMVGLTSGLLGVLVRFKAPVLSFFLLVLTVDYKIKGVSKKVIDEK